MKIKIESIQIENGRLVIEPTKDTKYLLPHITDTITQAKKPYQAEFKVFRKKRSLDSNAALWKMLSLMADTLHTSKDELYLEMLDRYGVFTHIVVKPKMVYRVKKEWKTVRELGKVTINGQTGIQLQCYFGSSTYDSKEFATLLDGVIAEAKELGIEFISKEDRNIMIDEWGK